MPQTELTARFVLNLKPLEREEHWDTVVRGLVLRAGPRARTWGVVYTPDNGQKARVSIGEFPDMSLEQARRKAREVIGGVATGADPAAKARVDRTAMTVAGLADLYVEKYAKVHKRTWMADRRTLDVDVSPVIGSLKVTKVTRRDIRDVLDRSAEKGNTRQPDLILACLRKMFRWGCEQDYLASSPCEGISSAAPVTRRDRVLSEGEIIGLLGMLEAPETPATAAMRSVLRLLLLTGQRSGEVCGLHVSELDMAKKEWLIPSARTKNKLPHVIPLSDQALDILSAAAERAGPSGYLFRHLKDRPLKANAVSHAIERLYPEDPGRFTPHDIRRTVATEMAGIGVQPHVVEAVLNHISGAKASVAGIYNRYSYAAEKRAALQQWADHLDALISKAMAEAAADV